jgi:hypothetical protein
LIVTVRRLVRLLAMGSQYPALAHGLTWRCARSFRALRTCPRPRLWHRTGRHHRTRGGSGTSPRSTRAFSAVMRERVLVNTRSKPHLPVRVRMQFEGVRQRLAVLAPREGILAGRSRGRHSEALCDGTWNSVFSQAADLGVLQVHLSGGEPALRQDLEALVETLSARGVYTNLISSHLGQQIASLSSTARRMRS